MLGLHNHADEGRNEKNDDTRPFFVVARECTLYEHLSFVFVDYHDI